MILRAIAKDRWSVLDPVCLFSFLHRCNIVMILLFLIFTAVFLDSPAEFTVDTRAVPKKPGDGPGKVSCLVNNPSGSRSEPVITTQPDGQHRVVYTPFEEGMQMRNFSLQFRLFKKYCFPLQIPRATQNRRVVRRCPGARISFPCHWPSRMRSP